MRYWPKIQVKKRPRTQKHLAGRAATNRPAKNPILFWANDQGAALVEAALGLPILFSAVIGVLEVANFFFISAAVENAVLHASRFGLTGQTENGSTREQQVRDVIQEQTFGRVDMETINIETLVYEQFGDIGAPEPYSDDNGSGTWEAGEAFTDVNGNGTWDDDLSVAGLGSGGDIVLYRISYNAQSLTGFGDWALRQINISATVAVRNEPY
jgi:TadE-like protein